MPKLLLIDFETTSVDPKLARPIEWWATYYNTDTKEEQGSGGYIWCDSYGTIPEEILRLTGIDLTKCKATGQHPKTLMEMLTETIERIDYVVAHNGNNYDKILYAAECARHGITPSKKLWLDTRTDIDYQINGACRVLSHLAFEHDVSFDKKTLHSAAGDVFLMLELIKKYDINDIIEFATAPRIIIKAMVSYDNREDAKKRKFGWEKIGDRVFPKSWVKKILEKDLEQEKKDSPFSIVVLEKHLA